MKSHIEFCNGKPFISVDGKLYSASAYTSYFEECAEYGDFIENGYKMFFINVSFTSLPINNVTGFTPFRKGVFESDEPDYSEFDGRILAVLEKCPDAMIFPRINISMPKRWINENTEETVATVNGGNRESLYSEKFLEDGGKLLKEMVSHIRSSSYSGSVAGYQLCGGTTQEWMHHDMFGSFSEKGLEGFRAWMKEKYGCDNTEIPSKEDFEGKEPSDTVKKYALFCSEMNAKTVEHFAKLLKEYTNGEQITGVFYGYSAFVSDYLLGLHGLRHIIASPYIDFFSSPCCYDNNRQLGTDWGDMLPADSVRLHGKLYFTECDIRTHLTKGMQESRPGFYPDGIYTLNDENGKKTVWSGPETAELSVSAVRKAFSHQLTKGSGVWWFDMWGGWYHDEDLMKELCALKEIYDSSLNKDTESLPSAETVLFIDERAYANLIRGSALSCAVNNIRVAMGNTGIPFDMYMVEDAKTVLPKYKAAVFSAPVPSEKGKEAAELCRGYGIPFIQVSKEELFNDAVQLRDFLVSAGVHCYNDKGNVIYSGNGFLGIHSVSDGTVNVALPNKFRITPLLGCNMPEQITDGFSLGMKKYETVLFELNKV
ncbi:MAG: hypothetical protein E7535_07860 [Ruminococcaceae bacterium]|nr:hypothetical protein [Oscillospiraceae bacterium]